MFAHVVPYRKLFCIIKKHLASLLISVVLLGFAGHIWTVQIANYIGWEPSISRHLNNITNSKTLFGTNSKTLFGTNNSEENRGLRNISFKMDEIMRARNSRLNEICHSELTAKHVNYSIKAKEFFINDEYKLIWCNVFKAASTTWIFNFLKMKNISEYEIRRNSKHGTMAFSRSHFYPRPSLNKLKKSLANEEYTSFMIVRDPLERLLSTYINKIKKYSRYYEWLKCRMIQSSFRWMVSKRCSPTFSDFVTYILKSNESYKDEHWASYVSFCSPCQTQFTFILHFENLKKEHSFLSDKIPKLKEIGIDRHINYHSRMADDIIKKYVSQLNTYQLLGLANDVYKYDYQMFGYDIEKYKKYVSNSLLDLLFHYFL